MAKKARKPLKRQTKASKKGLVKARKATFWDRLPNNREEFLKLMIFLTEKRIVPGKKDDMMVNQAERLKKELSEYLSTKS